jgi:hypothetical protein
MELTQEDKQVVIHLLTNAIDSLHSSLCLEDIGDEAAYILSSRYMELTKIRNIIEGKENEA